MEGEIVAEAYTRGFDRFTPMAGWSMTKSVFSALVGITIKKGTIDLNDKELFKKWSNDNRRKISVKNLLHMTSGLHFDETYGLTGDVAHMLFNAESTGEFALGKRLQNPPGSSWSYSSGTTNILSLYLKRKIGLPDYHHFPRNELFDPIGIDSAIIEPDPSGTL